MKTYKLILTLILVTAFFTGCDDYLDEAPSKSNGVLPSSIQDLEGLLNERATFQLERANEIATASDDFELNSDYFDANNTEITIGNIHEATWSTENTNTSLTLGWTGEWSKIFTANLVLEALDIVEGTDEEKANIKAEAHFIRAYSYFLLATTYCLALKGNETEMGLPIKTVTSFEESLKRATLQETYDFMTADIEEALKITRKLDYKNGLKRIWRASTASVNAFAARYYLAIHDYEKAEKYAQEALDEDNTLRNLNTDLTLISQTVTIESDGDPSTTETAEIINAKLDNTTSKPDILVWGEFYYERTLLNSSGELYPSDDLLNTYDQVNDLRFEYYMVENHSYIRGTDGINNPLFSQTGYSSPIAGNSNRAVSGPSVAEMYLIVAECQVRNGDFNTGLENANVLRRTRMRNTASTSDIELSASSQEEALTQILEERRRELPFVLRWYDVKRYNSNDDPSDDVDALVRSFYPYSASAVDQSAPLQTYELLKGSRKYAHPIPQDDIIASAGVLLQNTY
ncbi:hypothetical protein GCM10022291_14390 [Postechiella marina]|uniref:RagB/SusD family nutrient uptake outer membrane protein n=1 Tax=Postechiella marina TaxID=943941 RepID=A0ABP8C6G7_9FLAO